MIVRVYGFRGRNRAATIALVILALAVGATLVAFALALILALAAAGTVIGAGMLLYRRLTRGRRRDAELRSPLEHMVLDPSREVFPDSVPHGLLSPNESDRDAR
jgi:hypothetical protein